MRETASEVIGLVIDCLSSSGFAVGGGGSGNEGASVVGRCDDDGIDFRRFASFANIGELDDFDGFFL